MNPNKIDEKEMSLTVMLIPFSMHPLVLYTVPAAACTSRLKQDAGRRFEKAQGTSTHISVSEYVQDVKNKWNCTHHTTGQLETQK